MADLDTLGLGESAAAVGTVVTGVELIEPEAFVGDAVPALDAVDEVVAPRLDGATNSSDTDPPITLLSASTTANASPRSVRRRP